MPAELIRSIVDELPDEEIRVLNTDEEKAQGHDFRVLGPEKDTVKNLRVVSLGDPEKQTIGDYRRHVPYRVLKPKEPWPGRTEAVLQRDPEKMQNIGEVPIFVGRLGANISHHSEMESVCKQYGIPEEFSVIKEFATLDKEGWFAELNMRKRLGVGAVERADLEKVLHAWQFSSDQFDRVYRNRFKFSEIVEDYWDSKAVHFSDALDDVLHPERRRTKDRSLFNRENVIIPGFTDVALNKERTLYVADLSGRQVEEISVEEVGSFEGLQSFIEILRDPNSESRREVLNYLTYSVWLSKNITKLTSPYPGDETAEYYIKNLKKYEFIKEVLMPVIAEGVYIFAEDGDNDIVRHVLENLETMGEADLAADLLAIESLSDQARLNIAVQQMNVFGIVPTIERISARSGNSEALTKLYSTLQGQDIEALMTNLTEVYKAVDFHEYVLNNPELTGQEAALIRSKIQKYANRVGKRPEEVRIVDIGAGTGRHTVALHKQGLKVTALEFEPHHVQKIKEQDPDIKAAVVDWYNIPYPEGSFPNDISPEVFYCLGRTILHNNSPEKMVRFFDEMQRILVDGGVGIIDIPKIPEDRITEVNDEYSDEINRYASHLESLGVEPGKARNIFDGPDEKHKFNRMAMTDTQFRAYAKLFGFKVTEVQEAPIGEAALFDNAYYVVEKDTDFKIEELSPEEFRAASVAIGLLDPGVDYNRKINSWEVPLGVPVMYMSYDEPDSIEVMRRAYKEGRLGEISTQMQDGLIYFELGHRPAR